MKYSVYVVEDEQPALKRLLSMLEKINHLQISGYSENGRKAIEEIELIKPDIVFLDVHLNDMSGIDILPLINHKPQIIFATAYDNYAVQAFEIRAVDYLLKPFTEKRLREAVDKAVSRLQSLTGSFDEIKQLLTKWQPQNDYLERVPSKVGDKIYILNDDDIVFFASEDKYLFAHLYEKKYLINFTLEQLEFRLNSEKFFRIHRSIIVNLNYISTIESVFNGGYSAVVKDKKRTVLNVSRSAAKKLKAELGL